MDDSVSSAPPADSSAVQLIDSVADSQIPAIYSLYTAAYNDGHWPTKPTLDSLTRRIHSALLTLTLTPTAATHSTHSIIGFLLVSGAPADPLLEDVIVHASHKAGGHGRRLVEAMQAAVCDGRLRGGVVASRVECYCGWSVKGFYERCGFVMVRGEQGGRCLMRWVVSGK